MRLALLYPALIILICSLLYQCNDNINIRQKYDFNINSLTDSIRYYKNSLGTQTASIKTLNGDKAEIERMLIKKDNELRLLTKQFTQLKSVTKIKSNIKIDTIKTAFENYIKCDTTFYASGNINTKWYSLNYKVTNDSLTISPFAMHTETTVITGLKRKWFLGKQTLYTDVTHSNPYIHIDNIKAAEVTIAQPWYKKWYVWLAAGVTAGIMLK